VRGGFQRISRKERIGKLTGRAVVLKVVVRDMGGKNLKREKGVQER